MTENEFRHSFALCAYQESPFLEDCIRSLMAQTVPSEIICATSTPNAYIEGLCEKYGIPYFVNPEKAGITNDWNFAYDQCTAPVITIAHQDDLYFPEYTEKLREKALASEKPLLFFTDYMELRGEEYVSKNKLLRIKRVMLLPLRLSVFRGSRFIRRRILSFGSPICCPSAAFFRDNIPGHVFRNHFRTNEDWEAWERLSSLEGDFLYCREAEMAHRIHEGSETSAAIRETGRGEEDIEMFRKFWPQKIAVLLAKAYGTSEKSNQI